MKQARRTRLANPRRSDRTGAVVVETAICLPILALMLLSTIEFANAIYLKQIVTTAAYETARLAIREGSTDLAATTRGQEVLLARGISDGVITITPSVDGVVARGTHVVVRVETDATANAISPVLWLAGKKEVAEMVMTKL